MAERPPHEQSPSRETSLPDAKPTADEVEQHQRPDGALEGTATFDDVSDEPLTPDMIEQRQRPDGALEGTATFDDVSDEPLTPDMIEQRRIVEDDELSEDRRSE